MARFGSLICLRLWLQAEKPLSGDCCPGTIRLTNRLFVVDINYTWYCYCRAKNSLQRHLGLKLHGQSWESRNNTTDYECWFYDSGRTLYKHTNIHDTTYSVLRHAFFPANVPRISPLNMKPLKLTISYMDEVIKITCTRNQIGYYNINADASSLDRKIYITHRRHFKETKSTRIATKNIYEACIDVLYELQQ